MAGHADDNDAHSENFKRENVFKEIVASLKCNFAFTQQPSTLCVLCACEIDKSSYCQMKRKIAVNVKLESEKVVQTGGRGGGGEHAIC